MRTPVFGTELQGFQTGPYKSGCAAIDGLSIQILDYDLRGTINVAKTKKLICVFVFTFAKNWFS